MFRDSKDFILLFYFVVVAKANFSWKKWKNRKRKKIYIWKRRLPSQPSRLTTPRPPVCLDPLLLYFHPLYACAPSNLLLFLFLPPLPHLLAPSLTLGCMQHMYSYAWIVHTYAFSFACIFTWAAHTNTFCTASCIVRHELQPPRMVYTYVYVPVRITHKCSIVNPFYEPRLCPFSPPYNVHFCSMLYSTMTTLVSSHHILNVDRNSIDASQYMPRSFTTLSSVFPRLGKIFTPFFAFAVGEKEEGKNAKSLSAGRIFILYSNSVKVWCYFTDGLLFSFNCTEWKFYFHPHKELVVYCQINIYLNQIMFI